jgi:hypothetical protein
MMMKLVFVKVSKMCERFKAWRLKFELAAYFPETIIGRLDKSFGLVD